VDLGDAKLLFTQAWRTSRSFGLSLFATAIGVTFLARFPGAEPAAIAGGASLLLALVTWRVLRRRKRLIDIIERGTQVPARIGAAKHNVASTNVPGVRVRWSNLTVELQDGSVTNLVSLDRTLENAPPGCWIRGLVHPDHPGMAVPVGSI